MKFLLLFVLVLSSCNFFINEEDGFLLEYDIDNPTFDTPAQLIYWASAFVTHERDYGEYWQSPGETWKWATGDCEDSAIFALYLLKKDFGLIGYAVTGINKEDGTGHMWIEIEDEWYEAMWGYHIANKRYTKVFRNIELHTYGETMYRAEYRKW